VGKQRDLKKTKKGENQEREASRRKEHAIYTESAGGQQGTERNRKHRARPNRGGEASIPWNRDFARRSLKGKYGAVKGKIGKRGKDKLEASSKGTATCRRKGHNSEEKGKKRKVSIYNPQGGGKLERKNKAGKIGGKTRPRKKNC